MAAAMAVLGCTMHRVHSVGVAERNRAARHRARHATVAMVMAAAARCRWRFQRVVSSGGAMSSGGCGHLADREMAERALRRRW